MKFKRISILAAVGAIAAPLAFVGPAQAITISPTACVLTLPAKIVLDRSMNIYLTSLTLTSDSLTNCPDAANPLKTSLLEVDGYYNWVLEESTRPGLVATRADIFQTDSEFGSTYGTKRLEYNYLSLGTYVPASPKNTKFIRSFGLDGVKDDNNNGGTDDIYYPMTVSNGIEVKFRSDVSVKTKKKNGIITVSVMADRNLDDPFEIDVPKYINKGDKVSVYRDGKLVKKVKLGTNGKANFTIKDKKGANNYSVVLPALSSNFEGSATFVK